MDYRGHLKRSHCISYIITGKLQVSFGNAIILIKSDIRETVIYKCINQFSILTEKSLNSGFDPQIFPRVKSIRSKSQGITNHSAEDNRCRI